MKPFDQAWALLKAVEFDPQAEDIREARPFKAYRSIPTKFLDEVLSEGLQPRSIAPWNPLLEADINRHTRYGRNRKERLINEKVREIKANDSRPWPDNHIDQQERRRERRNKAMISLFGDPDEGIWSFKHRRGALPNTKSQRWFREMFPYGAMTHPALSARYFGDAHGDEAARMAGTAEYIEREPLSLGLGDLVDDGRDQVTQEHSVVGSTILPPGRRFNDLDWSGGGRRIGSQPILTTDPIPARYLEEAIPVDSQGRIIHYTQGSANPDLMGWSNQ